MANCGKLSGMGNKDRGKREVKKPPKKKPTAHELARAAAPVFKKPA
jgi:hypothetical protein